MRREEEERGIGVCANICRWFAKFFFLSFFLSFFLAAGRAGGDQFEECAEFAWLFPGGGITLLTTAHPHTDVAGDVPTTDKNNNNKKRRRRKEERRGGEGRR